MSPLTAVFLTCLLYGAVANSTISENKPTNCCAEAGVQSAGTLELNQYRPPAPGAVGKQSPLPIPEPTPKIEPESRTEPAPKVAPEPEPKPAPASTPKPAPNPTTATATASTPESTSELSSSPAPTACPVASGKGCRSADQKTATN